MCAKPVIFGVPHFQGPLNEICDSYGITRSFQHNLITVNGESKEAIFKQSDNQPAAVYYIYPSELSYLSRNLEIPITTEFQKMLFD